jgi:hypothetical protein
VAVHRENESCSLIVEGLTSRAPSGLLARASRVVRVYLRFIDAQASVCRVLSQSTFCIEVSHVQDGLSSRYKKYDGRSRLTPRNAKRSARCKLASRKCEIQASKSTASAAGVACFGLSAAVYTCLPCDFFQHNTHLRASPSRRTRSHTIFCIPRHSFGTPTQSAPFKT